MAEHAIQGYKWDDALNRIKSVCLSVELFLHSTLTSFSFLKSVLFLHRTPAVITHVESVYSTFQ